MKTLFIFIILFIVTSTSILGNITLKGDTVSVKKNFDGAERLFFTIGMPLTHFTRESKTKGIQTSYLNPGAELLINYYLINAIRLSTGLSYQYCKFYYSLGAQSNYTTSNELTIPLMATLNLFHIKEVIYDFTFGLYFGSYFRIVTDYGPPKVNFGEEPWVNNFRNYADFLSKKDLITDFYVSFGNKEIYETSFGIEAFFRYRLKERSYPINTNISRAFYGIKLKYQLNF